jgi:PUA domain protein
MFKSFGNETISGRSQAKTSVARGIRAQILASYPLLESVLDTVWNKKTVVELIKCRNTATLVCIEGQILFFQIRDGPFLPVLKLLHRFPDIMDSVQADKGAIKHVLSGSDVMDPG